MRIQKGSPLQQPIIAKRHGLRIIQELPFHLLYTEFNNHRRLKCFATHGCKCSNPTCNRVGTRLMKSLDAGGGIHIDLFTEDLHLMTVDHIIPKSKGGSKEDIRNLQPMCSDCNGEKGSKTNHLTSYCKIKGKQRGYIDPNWTPKPSRIQPKRKLKLAPIEFKIGQLGNMSWRMEYRIHKHYLDRIG